MKKRLIFILYIVVAFSFVSCNSTSQNITKSEDKKIKISLSSPSVHQTNHDEGELYFQKTKHQVFYKDIDQKIENGWKTINIYKTQSRGYDTYEIMKNVVTQKDYNGYGDEFKGITNITYVKANNYCHIKLNAMLISPYVFDSARKNKEIYKPKDPITTEMIASVDEENDEMYMNTEDNISIDNESDSSFILLNWNNEKYFNVSNTYRSNQTSFRCMRKK